MSGFIYYFGGESQTVESLRAMGFPFARGVGLPGGRVNGGPDTKVGYCVKLKAATHRAGYYPKEQEWKKTAGGWWIGWDKANPPGPADLERESQIGGHPVVLRDGNPWLVPVVREITGDPALPMAYGLGPKGIMIAEVPAEYSALWTYAVQLWAFFGCAIESADENAETEFEYAECIAACAAALAVNYCVTLDELLALGLFGDHEIIEAGKAMIDFPTLLACVQKKNVVSTSSASANGRKDSDLDTVPVSPTSSSSPS